MISVGSCEGYLLGLDPSYPSCSCSCSCSCPCPCASACSCVYACTYCGPCLCLLVQLLLVRRRKRGVCGGWIRKRRRAPCCQIGSGRLHHVLRLMRLQGLLRQRVMLMGAAAGLCWSKRLLLLLLLRERWRNFGPRNHRLASIRRPSRCPRGWWVCECPRGLGGWTHRHSPRRWVVHRQSRRRSSCCLKYSK